MKRTDFFKAAAMAGALMCSTAISVQAAVVPDGTKLADEQVFTYRVLDQINSLDPQLAEDVDSAAVVNNLFEGLYNEDATGGPVPGVAESFDLSEDKTVYTFHLRDAKWSNGDPVTADDFVFGWQRAVDPATASTYAYFLTLASVVNAQDVIDGTKTPTELGVKAIDDKTFEVTLSAPTPYFPKMLAHSTLFPAPRAVVEKFGNDWTKPENIVSNGAYKLVTNAPGEQVALERNTNYWDDAKTVIDKVFVLTINDENQGLTRYLAGEVDKTDVPAGQYPAMLRDHPDDAHSAPRLCTYYFSINMTDSAPDVLKDVRVRQALSYAVDRDVIVDQILQGGQDPAYYFTPTKTSGFVAPVLPYAAMTQDERDAKAKELLAEAGYGPDNPVKIDYIYNTSEAHKKIATVVQQMWKEKLGVEMTITDMEFQSLLDQRHNADYQMARNAWCGDYNEASTFESLLDSKSEQNDSHYANADVDKWLAESKTAEDPNVQYKSIEEQVAKDVPLIPIYFYATVLMVTPNLVGWPYDNIEQIWYAKDFYKTAE